MLFKIFKALIVSGVLFCIGVYLLVFSSIVFPWERKDAILAVQEWGGLAPFPENVSDVSMGKSGSPFTRTFEVEFDSDVKSVEKWIQESKRLKSNKPKFEKGVKIYEVYPGEEKSIGGTVEIKDNHVRIKMSWS